MTEKKRIEFLINEPIEKSFAILMVLTENGDRVIRPIGGGWHNGINDTIEEMHEKFPNCKMKIYEENYNSWSKYFVPNGVSREQVL